MIPSNRLLLQFHITGRCNLRCKHCYRTEGDVEPLSLEDVCAVIDQFCDLADEYDRRYGAKRRAQINLTGGEPFMRRDFDDIVRYLMRHRERLSFAVLSNGSFLTDERLALLKEAQVKFVQLSLDGTRATHDALRAAGDHDRVLKTAKRLEACGIRTLISFTAHRGNMHELPEVADECRRHRVSKLWSDRLVPIGGGEELSALSMMPEDVDRYLSLLNTAKGSALTRFFHPHTEVAMDRALQFQKGGALYTCSAAKSLITVDEFGHILPCRRMPIPCGDVFSSTLKEVYFESKTFRALREPFLPQGCADCVFFSHCKGGARCQSYAVYGDPFHKDPGCGMGRDSGCGRLP